MKVLVVFLTEKNRQIVGGKVTEGEVKKGIQIEVVRGEELIGKGRLINLQKNKKDIEKGLIYMVHRKNKDNDEIELM